MTTTLTAPLHLSRLHLNERHRNASRDLSSPYALHQTLRWAFPGAGHADTPLPDGERLLWRQDVTLDPHTGEPVPTLIVQSITPPDWGALNARNTTGAGAGYLLGWSVRTINLTPALTPGRVLHFRLHANTTVRRRDETGHSAPARPAHPHRATRVAGPAGRPRRVRRSGRGHHPRGPHPHQEGQATHHPAHRHFRRRPPGHGLRCSRTSRP